MLFLFKKDTRCYFVEPIKSFILKQEYLIYLFYYMCYDWNYFFQLVLFSEFMLLLSLFSIFYPMNYHYFIIMF